MYQDLVFQQKERVLDSHAEEARCYVCSKGMDDGYSITAKKTTFGTLLFCNKHYSVDQNVGDVTAPCAADPTSDAYFANAPVVQLGAGLDH